MNKSIGIKVLSKACGVLPHVIRTWETRYQVFSPERTEGGQRLYGEDDIARGRLIGQLINQGHQISNLAKLKLKQLDSLLDKTIDTEALSESFSNVSLVLLFKYLEKYEIDNVVMEMQYLRMSCGSKEFVFNVVLPVMQDIGLKVAKGEYSITQEHIVSTIVRDQLGQLSLPNLGDQNRRVVLATPDGNIHELSILIADIICRTNRVPTSYLGASHPPQCLGEAVNALKVKTIVMGAVSSDSWDYGKNISNYLVNLDKHLKIKVKIVLGGGWRVDLPKFKNIVKVDFVESFEVFDRDLINFKLAV